MIINILGSTSRDYFSVTLKKTGFVSQQGNPMIVVEFGEVPQTQVESRDFIASGCSSYLDKCRKYLSVRSNHASTSMFDCDGEKNDLFDQLYSQ